MNFPTAIIAVIFCLISPSVCGRIERQANGQAVPAGAQEVPPNALPEDPKCFVGSKPVAINETAVVGNLVFLCSPSGIQVTGCAFTDENGKLIQAKVGEVVQVGNANHLCQGLVGPGVKPDQNTNANASASASSGAAADLPCIHDGTQHKPNETWTARSFRYICAPSGETKITACIIDDKNDLPVGQVTVKFGLLHRCYKEGNRVSYRSEICDVGGVKCDAASIAQLNASVANTAASSHAQPANNGGAKSVVGNGTSDNVAHATGDCVKDGQSHHSGETWIQNNFKYNCQSDGSITILGCVTDAKQEIQLGETWVLGGLQHVCSKRPNGAVYSAQLCGAQVQCGPEGLQKPTGNA